MATTRHQNTGPEEILGRSVRNAMRSIRALGPAMHAIKEPTSPQLARAVQATENKWRAIDAEFELLTSRDVAAALGSRSSSPRGFTADQRKAGKLLAIRWGNQYRYPGFQIRDGHVLPVIQQLISLADDSEWSPESLTMWLCTPTGWLSDKRPVDLLNGDPNAILDAARSEFTTEW
ncbi:hypothetical protein [Hoyosella subflava]|uniref:Antitoxin Xre/MbcA/ParS-like toxin-binding domain-containing protein n=1 Tax=Hoyosella subflava (strain DSM 45089 / JCM 17490 / NBRC 109087 / DQS3-9A1) TaxID=443218 RepID=F6ER86_HOYSD|nr:hypothetical protein [Hoyosella subflava]AEF41964.1 hypothetical protein AS9A_3524 [Hoyosella subflava DQS3-9A1]